MKNLTDAELMNLVRQKHSGALEELYDRYARLIFSMAVKSVRSEQAAREIVQTVFMRLWTSGKGYDPSKGKFVNWVITVTRHAAIDYVRKERRHVQGSATEAVEWERVPDTSSDRPEQWLEQQAVLENIQDAYRYLSDRQIELLNALYWQGYTLSEIARHNHEPIGTVKNRLHQALKILRQHISAATGAPGKRQRGGDSG